MQLTILNAIFKDEVFILSRKVKSAVVYKNVQRLKHQLQHQLIIYYSLSNSQENA